jgi:hypothetical protein
MTCEWTKTERKISCHNGETCCNFYYYKTSCSKERILQYETQKYCDGCSEEFLGNNDSDLKKIIYK